MNEPLELECRIGYRFRDPILLAAALTHRSYLNESRDEGTQDNERLEFLGDAVLGFVVSRMLYERSPAMAEGDLSRLRASLVGEKALAPLARSLDLGSFLVLGRGEEKTGGRGRSSILADAFEAIVAAVFLDGGNDAAAALVERLLGPLVDAGAGTAAARDYKSELQETTQAKDGSVPVYELVAEEGPVHERTFTVMAVIRGEKAGVGSGATKKEAEQAAAREALLSAREELRGCGS